MSNGTELLGIYTLKMVDKNVPSYQPYTLDFSPCNIVSCPALGDEGRYYFLDMGPEGDYILMAFANTAGSFNFPTSTMFFGKRNAYGEFEGVVGDIAGNGIAGWVAAPGSNEPNVSSDFGPVNNLNGANFQGTENPNDVEAIYQFRVEGNIGIVDYGTVQGGINFMGKYQTLHYNIGSEQLLVFANDRMITYGAVVREVGDNIELTNGMYMNPFAGPGYYNTWDAISQ